MGNSQCASDRRLHHTSELPQCKNNVNTRLPSGETLLTASIKADDARMVELVLTAGADPNLANSLGDTPLHVAALNDSQTDHVVSRLLKAGADAALTNSHNTSALQLACLVNNTPVAKTLADWCPESINHSCDCASTPLNAATEHGNKELVEFLLSKGALVNEVYQWGDSPLVEAVKHRHKHLVDLFLSKKADPNTVTRFGATAIHYAVISNQCDVTSTLLHAGCDVRPNPNQSGREDCFINYSPIGAAIHRDCSVCFHQLLDAGSDINFVDSVERMPLVYALVNSAWRCDGHSGKRVPSCSLPATVPPLDDSRIHFVRKLLYMGANIQPVWEKAIWHCRATKSAERAISLCIRAFPIPGNNDVKADSLLRSLILRKSCKAANLLLLAGHNPHKDINIMANNALSKVEESSTLLNNLQQVCSSARTLQNLCVIAIRHSMRGSGNVLHKTEQLALPSSLCDMVTLNCS